MIEWEDDFFSFQMASLYTQKACVFIAAEGAVPCKSIKRHYGEKLLTRFFSALCTSQTDSLISAMYCNVFAKIFFSFELRIFLV